MPPLALTKDMAIIFFAQATQELECYDEEDDADAGGCEGGGGCDMPGWGDEAWVVRWSL